MSGIVCSGVFWLFIFFSVIYLFTGNSVSISSESVHELDLLINSSANVEMNRVFMKANKLDTLETKE